MTSIPKKWRQNRHLDVMHKSHLTIPCKVTFHSPGRVHWNSGRVHKKLLSLCIVFKVRDCLWPYFNRNFPDNSMLLPLAAENMTEIPSFLHRFQSMWQLYFSHHSTVFSNTNLQTTCYRWLSENSFMCIVFKAPFNVDIIFWPSFNNFNFQSPCNSMLLPLTAENLFLFYFIKVYDCFILAIIQQYFQLPISRQLNVITVDYRKYGGNFFMCCYQSTCLRYQKNFPVPPLAVTKITVISFFLCCFQSMWLLYFWPSFNSFCFWCQSPDNSMFLPLTVLNDEYSFLFCTVFKVHN